MRPSLPSVTAPSAAERLAAELDGALRKRQLPVGAP